MPVCADILDNLLALCLFLVYHIHSFCCRPRASTLPHVSAWGFPLYADLIRIEFGDTELAEAKKAEQKRQLEIMNNFQIGVTG